MTSFSHNLAIAIGINNYSKGIAKLKKARSDVEELTCLLSSPDYGYQVDLITDDTERKPTLIQSWAIARNLALNLYRENGFENMAQAQRLAGFTLDKLKTLFSMI